MYMSIYMYTRLYMHGETLLLVYADKNACVHAHISTYMCTLIVYAYVGIIHVYPSRYVCSDIHTHTHKQNGAHASVSLSLYASL